MGGPAEVYRAGAGRPIRRRWGALSVVLATSFVGALDASVMAVAGPSIQRGLGSTPAQVQWVVSGYALMFGLSLIPAGRLGDAVGHRRVFLLALAGFVAGSAAAGAAPSAALLIVARLAQGLCAGAMAPQSAAMIVELFDLAERGRAFGVSAAVGSIAMGLGPLAGGTILTVMGEPDGWRWTMYVNVPIGMAAVLCGVVLLPRSGAVRARSFDPVGALLLGAAVLAVLLPLGEAGSGGLGRWWWLFLVAGTVGVGFVRWERRVVARGRDPVVDMGLLAAVPGFARGAAVGSSYFAGFGGVWLAFALFFQDGLGYSPVQSGLAVTPFAAGATVAATGSGWMLRRWGQRIVTGGLALSCVGLVATAAALVVAAGSAMTGAVIAVPLLVAGVGGGMVLAPNTTSALRSVPVERAGVAGGVLQAGQRVGAAVGTAAVAGIYFVVLAVPGSNAAVAIAAAVCGAAVGVAGALAIAARGHE